ncbi:MAG: tRNA uridine-5-carboxymethylaminomethyl(34) synthesis GTPase MnmE [Rhodothermales bacterium]|nr:tRNA uridine-5-carboxymethylaminomethyl(34) synthesis GTPase MnmE [Rhodothermales bacterium]
MQGQLSDPGGQTIAAVATARGRSALSVIRTSGRDAVRVADTSFRGSSKLADVAANTATFGYVVDHDGAQIDQVVATVFRAPRSATGEDVVEISSHGGDVASRMILDRLLAAGARLAEPGEFTQRAFLNGKIDLAQAEAVADLIHASSSLSHRVSLTQLAGRYSEVLSGIRTELLDVAALVELELDFSEEDVEFADKERLRELLQSARALLSQLLSSYKTGRLVRDGVRVVIGGKPNAGKSTLLNALVGFDRAIVSPTPGTTRDEIEAEAEIGGVLFRLVDTAGLRDATDSIEAEGVRRAQRSLESADVVLYVVDGSVPPDQTESDYIEALRESLEGLPLLVVVNKSDLIKPEQDHYAEARTVTPRAVSSNQEESEGSVTLGSRADRVKQSVRGLDSIQSTGLIRVSADRGRTDPGELSLLVAWLQEVVVGDLSSLDASPIVTNQRHQQHLRAALQSVTSALDGLDRNASGDVLSVDLRSALFEIGSITGEITNEDVLGQIFSRFCIGK